MSRHNSRWLLDLYPQTTSRNERVLSLGPRLSLFSEVSYKDVQSALLASCKGIQDSCGFWIPRHEFRIPDSLSVKLGSRIPRADFQIPKPRIPDSNYNKMTRQPWHSPCPVVSKWIMWNVYEYEIFSILSIAHAWTSVILGGKRDSRRHSTTSFNENVVVAGTSYQMLEVLTFCNRERA